MSRRRKKRHRRTPITSAATSTATLDVADPAPSAPAPTSAPPEPTPTGFKHLTPAEVLAVTHRDPRAILLLADADGNEDFLRKELGTIWRRPGDAAHTLPALITACGAVDLYFSPLSYASLASSGPLLALDVLWARIALRLSPPGFANLRGVDQHDRGEAYRRLSGIRPEPGIIMDEGTMITGLWRIAPIAVDDVRAQIARRRLSDALNPDRPHPDGAAVDDAGRRTLLLLPQVRCGSLFPATTCMALEWQAERVYDIDEFQFVRVNGGAR